MILEAPYENSLSTRIEGRSNSITGMRFDHSVVESERDNSSSIDFLHRSWRKSLAHERSSPLSRSFAVNVLNTSLVTVLRSAKNHLLHPNRWYHHSSCTPAKLLRP